jgi:salicylate hydroxylase
LWTAAKDIGVDLRLGCEVTTIDFQAPSVELAGGEVVKGDVVIGADGMSRLNNILPIHLLFFQTLTLRLPQ